VPESPEQPFLQAVRLVQVPVCDPYPWVHLLGDGEDVRAFCVVRVLQAMAQRAPVWVLLPWGPALESGPVGVAQEEGPWPLWPLPPKQELREAAAVLRFAMWVAQAVGQPVPGAWAEYRTVASSFAVRLVSLPESARRASFLRGLAAPRAKGWLFLQA
jgi:hypothetical protein